MAAVSVIVPAYNAASTLAETLAALAAQDFDEPFEVIVIDDGSSDETVAIAGRAEVGARVLEGQHRGPAAARNSGVSVASGAVLAFTDADCAPEPRWITVGVAATASADLVQGVVRPDPSARRLPFDRTVSVGRETGLYECANLFVRREAFDRVGGFEDWLGARMGKQLAEDAWLGWRMRAAGATTAFETGAVVNHAVFRRRLPAYVAERARLAYFPAIVRQMPGLRRTLLYGRLFISPRAALFDLAIVAGLAGLASPYALAGALPYAALALRDAVRWRSRALSALVGEVLADVVGFGSLLAGAVRSRSLVL